MHNCRVTIETVTHEEILKPTLRVEWEVARDKEGLSFISRTKRSFIPSLAAISWLPAEAHVALASMAPWLLYSLSSPSLSCSLLTCSSKESDDEQLGNVFSNAVPSLSHVCLHIPYFPVSCVLSCNPVWELGAAPLPHVTLTEGSQLCSSSHCMVAPGDSSSEGTICIVFTKFITKSGGNSVSLYMFFISFADLSSSHILFLSSLTDISKHILHESRRNISLEHHKEEYWHRNQSTFGQPAAAPRPALLEGGPSHSLSPFQSEIL